MSEVTSDTWPIMIERFKLYFRRASVAPKWYSPLYCPDFPLWQTTVDSKLSPALERLIQSFQEWVRRYRIGCDIGHDTNTTVNNLHLD